MRRAWIASLLFAHAAHAAPPQDAPSTPPCIDDRARLLALDEQAFDQDPAGGWRAVAATPGCNRAAADLVAEYRRTRGGSELLAWHEGQLLAFEGDAVGAIAAIGYARKPADQDPSGWNAYVDATLAFLRDDRVALDAARARLAATPSSPDLPPVVDGVIALPDGTGGTVRMPWPQNLDVVDGLRRCFGKPYIEAYGPACRVPMPSAPAEGPTAPR